MGRLSSISLLGAWLLGTVFSGPAHALNLESAGRFHVASSQVAAPGMTGTWTVHYLVPDVRRPRTPVILLPSAGLSAYIYQATPDGRGGWAQALARAGYGSYAVETIATPEPGVIDAESPSAAEPVVLERLWRRWGFGRAPGEPYGNVRFPVHAIEQLYASLPGMPPTHSNAADAAVTASDPVVERLLVLLERTGPATLLAHGASAPVALAAAYANPAAVRGLVLVEPTGCARQRAEVERIASIPFLAVFGDYLVSREQGSNVDACRALATVIGDHPGGRADLLVLPEEGIFGNTYLLMQDDNSADVAARIIRWMNRRVD